MSQGYALRLLNVPSPIVRPVPRVTRSSAPACPATVVENQTALRPDWRASRFVDKDLGAVLETSARM